MRWRIEGIDSDARRTASAAAKAAGLPLGRWLERAIADRLGTGENPESGAAPQAVRPSSVAAAPNVIARSSALQSPPVDPIPTPARPIADTDRPAGAIANTASVAKPAPPVIAASHKATPHPVVTRVRPVADRIADQKARLSARLVQSRQTIVMTAAALSGCVVAAAIIVGALWHWRDWPGGPVASRNGAPSIITTKPPSSPRQSAESLTAETPPAPSATSPSSRTPPAETAAPSTVPVAPPSSPSQTGVPPSSTRPPGPRAAPTAPQPLSQVLADLQRDAATGDPMAQHDLALAYVTGRGVPQDYTLAAEWFEKATEHGLERAQYNLAVLYENGLGVARDLTRSRELYAAAAEQGFALAQHNLGVIYAEGRGVTRDFRIAALWFRRAADQGVASAQFNLGMIYERGLAGQADERTAHGLYRQAAAGGSEAAVARLAVLEGRIAPSADTSAAGQKLTRAEIAETQRLLTQLAFDPGPTDGRAGPTTRTAIRNYQQVAGLPVDGQLSTGLLTHLRQVVGMMAQP